MHLQILPGGGNLLHAPYRAVYDLLEELATRRGYHSVATSIWRAHAAYGSHPAVPLTFPEALAVARDAVAKLERAGQPYDILSRSFGCTVGVALLDELKTKHLRRLIFWGPVSYADYWRLFVRDLPVQKEKAAARSVVIDESFFPTHVPLEVFLPAVRVPTILARGTLDDLCPEAFLVYLRSLLGSQCSVEIRTVPGARHEVNRGDDAAVLRAYEEGLFAGTAPTS